jgi:hypothetical protein
MPARKPLYILIIIIFTFNPASAQTGFRFSGQLSSWMNLNLSTDLPLWAGARYIPQANYGLSAGSDQLFDVEISVNLSGTAGLKPFDSLDAEGILKPYRAWIRYSGKQFEVRLGLQKLSFGSALMLRPLMWFDQLDPRDPLQLTDGVWGLLGRYYFLNNANIWLWSLYGNKDRSGWELIKSNSKIPEFGGRVQLPVPSGEIAFTYNHRVADSRETGGSVMAYEKIPEDRYGFDAKWDFNAGLWIEGSFTHKHRDLDLLTNQLILNAGIDYTLSAGNGIYIAIEHLIFTYDEKPFAFSDPNHFSLMTISYPIGLIDKISAIIYYGWNDKNAYSFLTWQREFDKISLYLMAYWNPELYELPAQYSTRAIYAGKGMQIMFVFNH